MSLQASQAACCVSVRVSRLCPRVASLSACRVSHRVSHLCPHVASLTACRAWQAELLPPRWFRYGL